MDRKQSEKGGSRKKIAVSTGVLVVVWLGLLAWLYVSWISPGRSRAAAATNDGAPAGADTTTLVGKPAPDLSLQTIAGKKVRLSNEKGKVVVLDFWATWCPPCRENLPHIQHLSANKDLAAKGLVVWAVNAQETPDTIKKFLTDNHYTFHVPQDAQGATMQAYLVHGIPTTVIVGRDGSIKNVFIGFGDGVAETIDNAVNKALAE